MDKPKSCAAVKLWCGGDDDVDANWLIFQPGGKCCYWCILVEVVTRRRDEMLWKCRWFCQLNLIWGAAAVNDRNCVERFYMLLPDYQMLANRNESIDFDRQDVWIIEFGEGFAIWCGHLLPNGWMCSWINTKLYVILTREIGIHTQCGIVKLSHIFSVAW